MRGNQAESRKTYKNTRKIPRQNTLLVRETEDKISLVDMTKQYMLSKGHVQIGTEIPTDLANQIKDVLRNNQDRFVWEGEAPTQVDRQIATHKLNVDPSFPARR